MICAMSGKFFRGPDRKRENCLGSDSELARHLKGITSRSHVTNTHFCILIHARMFNFYAYNYPNYPLVEKSRKTRLSALVGKIRD